MSSVSSATGDAKWLVGDWVGGFSAGSNYVFLQLHFKKTNEVLAGTYDVPLFFQQGRRVQNLETDVSSAKFELSIDSQSCLFTGKFKDGVLRGLVKQGASERECHFARLATIKAENYVGLYEVEKGHSIFIRAGTESGLISPQYIDFKTSGIGLLFPQTKVDFFSGPAALIAFPEEVKVKFSMDRESRATGLDWSGKQVFSAKRVETRKLPVTFTNGSIKLAGELLLPSQPGPHPVVVFAAGGAAAGNREMFRHLAELFVSQGIAAFIYDKRGIGGSTGNWLTSSFDDLAGDVLTIVGELKSRDDVRSKKIGLMGASQSGWIVALAASKSPDVAFIISQAGPGVGVEECEIYRCEAWLRADGFAEEEIKEAMQYHRQRYKCARTGEGWEALEETERNSRGKRWFAYAGGQAGKDHPFWKFWNLIRTYDPVPVLEKVQCPVLALFGDKDTFVPTEKSAEAWEMALKKAGNRDVTIRVFENADHSMIECRTGGLKETAKAQRFVPEYFNTLVDWTLKQAK